jgi:hypothetical protein
MTEQEWLACGDPARLLRHLRHRNPVQPGAIWCRSPDEAPRKWRLYGCGCYRRAWDILDRACKVLVEAGERIADIPPEQVDWEVELTALGDLMRAVRFRGAYWLLNPVDTAAMAGQVRVLMARKAHKGPGQPAYEARRAAIFRERESQAALVRCVFGNPFRPTALDPSWRTSTVQAIARQVYEERDFPSLPILADALEEAGCTAALALDHLRGGGPHARGCWVVDLALARD